MRHSTRVVNETTEQIDCAATSTTTCAPDSILSEHNMCKDYGCEPVQTHILQARSKTEAILSAALPTTRLCQCRLSLASTDCTLDVVIRPTEFLHPHSFPCQMSLPCRAVTMSNSQSSAWQSCLRDMDDPSFFNVAQSDSHILRMANAGLGQGSSISSHPDNIALATHNLAGHSSPGSSMSACASRP